MHQNLSWVFLVLGAVESDNLSCVFMALEGVENASGPELCFHRPFVG